MYALDASIVLEAHSNGSHVPVSEIERYILILQIVYCFGYLYLVCVVCATCYC